jgi:hypothetical protein
MRLIGKPTIKTVAPESIYWQTFKMLYADLEDTFRYVHPVADHHNVYSFKYYELLLRSCTEFESVCRKFIIQKQLTTKKPDKTDIRDYFLLNQYDEDRVLSKFHAIFKFDHDYVLTPLDGWNKSHALSWYQDYNKVKHHRASEFQRASLLNVLNAVSGLFLIIYACGLCSRSELTFTSKYGKVKNNDSWPLMLKDANSVKESTDF